MSFLAKRIVGVTLCVLIVVSSLNYYLDWNLLGTSAVAKKVMAGIYILGLVFTFTCMPNQEERDDH